MMYTFTEELFVRQSSGHIRSVRRAFASKLRGPGFKSWPGTVGGPAQPGTVDGLVTIIMLSAQPG